MNVHDIIQECQESKELGNDVAKIVYLALASEGPGYREYAILAKIFLSLSGKSGYSAPRDGDALLDALEEMGFWAPWRESRAAQETIQGE